MTVTARELDRVRLDVLGASLAGRAVRARSQSEQLEKVERRLETHLVSLARLTSTTLTFCITETCDATCC